MAATAMCEHVLFWLAHTAMHFVLCMKYSEMAMLDAKCRHKFGHVGFTLCKSTDAQIVFVLSVMTQGPFFFFNCGVRRALRTTDMSS